VGAGAVVLGVALLATLHSSVALLPLIGGVPVLAYVGRSFVCDGAATICRSLGGTGAVASAGISGASRRSWIAVTTCGACAALLVAQGSALANITTSIVARERRAASASLYVDAGSGAGLDPVSVLPDDARGAIAHAPGVVAVAGTRYVAGRVGTRTVLFQGVEAGLPDDALAQLGHDELRSVLDGQGVAISGRLASWAHLTLGEQLTVGGSTGAVHLPVVAVVDSAKNANGVVVVSLHALRRQFGVAGVSAYFVGVAGGAAGVHDAETGIEAALQNDRPARVMTGSSYLGLVRRSANSTVTLFKVAEWLVAGGALASLVAVYLLATAQRAWEVGLLSAIGAARRTIIAAFALDAVVHGALGGSFGALVGVALHRLLIPMLRTSTGLPVTYSFLWQSVATGWAVVTPLAAVASLVPAWRSSHAAPGASLAARGF
jgi:hypothetical protein